MSNEAKQGLPSIGEIESIAAKLRELQAGVEETFKGLDKEHQQREAWKEACRRLHEACTGLPSELGLSRLKENESHTLSKRRSGSLRLILGSSVWLH